MRFAIVDIFPCDGAWLASVLDEETCETVHCWREPFPSVAAAERAAAKWCSANRYYLSGRL